MKGQALGRTIIVAIAMVMAPITAYGQETDEGELSGLDRIAASAVLEGMQSSFDESLGPMLQALEEADDDPEALAQAYGDMALWALMYARGLDLVNFPDGVAPLIDDITTSHSEFSSAAEALAAQPMDESLLLGYRAAEEARLASIDALYLALGLPVPSGGSDSDAIGPAESPSPSAA